MDYISSDTNVWIDFSAIRRTELPFRLPFTYIMSELAIEDELITPSGIGQELVSLGLMPVKITWDYSFNRRRRAQKGCMAGGRINHGNIGYF